MTDNLNKRNFLIEIEYDGHEYYGWQRQVNKKTVQNEIETVLSKLYQRPIKLIGACRTDAGVSASGQIANFYLPAQLSQRFCLNELQKKLNAMLPEDIYIKKIKTVANNFHARFLAKSKVYQYHIILTKSPLKQRFAWYLPYSLNIKDMSKAAKLFVDHQDYRAFCKISDLNKDTKCVINKITIKQRGNEISIKIYGSRFLYKMARRIVGALVGVGRKQLSLTDIKNSLNGLGNRPIMVAPAKGLKLVKINYGKPDDD